MRHPAVKLIEYIHFVVHLERAAKEFVPDGEAEINVTRGNYFTPRGTEVGFLVIKDHCSFCQLLSESMIDIGYPLIVVRSIKY